MIQHSKSIGISFTGQSLIDAVKAVAREPVVRKEEGSLVRIGQTSDWPQRHFIVLADETESIDPAGNYTSLTVKPHFWPAAVYAVRYFDEDIEKELQALIDKLQEHLK